MQEIIEWLNGNRSYDAGAKLYIQYGADALLKQLFKENYTDFKQKKLLQVLQQMVDKKEAYKSQPEKKIISQATKPLLVHDVIEIRNDDSVNTESQKVIARRIDDLEDRIEDVEFDKSDKEEEFTKLSKSVEKISDEVERLKKSGTPVSRGWPPVMDETLQQLYDEWLPQFVEKKNLQARIYDVALAGEKDPVKKKEAGAMANKILTLRDACRKIYEKRDFYLKNKKLPKEENICDIPDNPLKWPLALQNYQRYLRDYKSKVAKIPATRENEKKVYNLQKQIKKYEWGIAKLKELLGL